MERAGGLVEGLAQIADLVQVLTDPYADDDPGTDPHQDEHVGDKGAPAGGLALEDPHARLLPRSRLRHAWNA